MDYNIKNGRVVFVDGVFDLFHFGHLEFLRQARYFGEYLIVGIHSDATVEKYKRRPIIPEYQRYAIIRSIKTVDATIEDSPLEITQKFINKWKISAVVHGDDAVYPEFYKVPINLGIMRYVPYTKYVSTSLIISMIKNGCV